MFDQLEKQLADARVHYQHVITGIDRRLAQLVSTDPKHLKAAVALQATYPFAPVAAVLVEATQPNAPAAAAPATTTKAKQKPGRKAKAK